MVVPNDESSWYDAMEFIYREKWKHLDEEQAGVVEARNMDRIASNFWYEAVRKVRLDRPMISSDIKKKISRWKMVRTFIMGVGKPTKGVGP
jgi:hypothetical protein